MENKIFTTILLDEDISIYEKYNNKTKNFWKKLYKQMRYGSTLFVGLLNEIDKKYIDIISINLRLAGFELKDIIMYLYNKNKYFPILLFVKPNDGSYINNALKWGVAGLNIDEGRIGIEKTKTTIKDFSEAYGNKWGKAGIKYPTKGYKENPPGRFPANIILDEESAEMLDEQSGISKSSPVGFKNVGWKHSGNTSNIMTPLKYQNTFNDIGGASRFFYKANTVKDLLKYLIKLTLMPVDYQVYNINGNILLQKEVIEKYNIQIKSKKEKGL